jgi:hypothetical protein
MIKCDTNMLSFIFDMTLQICILTSLRSLRQILDKHTTVAMPCSEWTSRHISHLRLQNDIAMRNPFSQNQSMNLYIYW